MLIFYGFWFVYEEVYSEYCLSIWLVILIIIYKVCVFMKLVVRRGISYYGIIKIMVLIWDYVLNFYIILRNVYNKYFVKLLL